LHLVLQRCTRQLGDRRASDAGVRVRKSWNL
jgi:hypothetical protein